MSDGMEYESGGLTLVKPKSKRRKRKMAAKNAEKACGCDCCTTKQQNKKEPAQAVSTKSTRADNAPAASKPTALPDNGANTPEIPQQNTPAVQPQNKNQGCSNPDTTNGKFTDHNVFNYLSESDCSEEQQQQPNTKSRRTGSLPPTENQRSPILPPIVLHNLPYGAERKTIMAKIQQDCIRPAHFRAMRDKLQVITYSTADFKKVQENCKKLHVQFHTYTLKEDRPIIMIIRGMDSSVLPEDIKSALELQNFTVRNVFNMQYKKQPSNLFQVNFCNTTSINQVVNSKLLCNYRISWEKMRKRANVTQCRNCQRFGHAASNCHLGYRCVKCKENHQPGGCKKSLADRPACVNCNLHHTANYGSCESKVNYIRNRQSRQNTTPPGFQKISNKPTQLRPRTNFVRDNLSYAQAASSSFLAPQGPPASTCPAQSPHVTNLLASLPQKINIPTPQCTPMASSSANDGDFAWFMKEIQDMFNMNLFTLIKSLKEFRSSCDSIQNPEEKLIAMMNFLCQLAK